MTDLFLQFKSDDNDIEYLVDQVRLLQKDLLDLNVEDVKPAVSGSPPPGSKSLAAIDWTTLLVTVAGTAGGISLLMSHLGGWLGRNRESEMTMTLPNGASLTLKGDISKQQHFDEIVGMVTRAYRGEPEPEETALTGTEALVSLREKMIAFLKLEDIEIICFDMGIDYEMLSGDQKGKKVRSLLLATHPQRLEALREQCALRNSAIDWYA
ncbi:MAG: hypothetical protein AAF633_09940 [Chloroflexota bacterium]